MLNQRLTKIAQPERRRRRKKNLLRVSDRYREKEREGGRMVSAGVYGAALGFCAALYSNG